MLLTKIGRMGVHVGRSSSLSYNLHQKLSTGPTVPNNDGGRKRVAVLGSGVSGLAAVKSCLDEGLLPVCFEQRSTIGGLWNFNKHVGKQQSASVYEGLLMNMSREMTGFSDFPVPDNMPTFLSSHQFLNYLNEYATHFRLRPHVKFDTQVLKVAPLTPGAIDGGWRVHFKKTPMEGKSEIKELENDQATLEIDENDGTVEVSDFDAVIVCTGAYSKPVFPDIPGIDAFEGKLMHAGHMRTSDVMKDKNVLVIGNQNSAGDAAVMATNVAKQVTLSVGDSGAFILPRFLHNGRPLDVSTSRMVSMYAPKWWKNYKLEAHANRGINHDDYGLSSRYALTNGANIISSDDLGPAIKAGQVAVRPAVTRLDSGMATYSDGRKDGPYDLIICATGYLPDFTHVQADMVKGTSRLNYPIYKGVFPVSSEKPTIASVGLTQNYGACPPVFEIQSRWAARVLAGRCQLPDPADRKAFFEDRRNMYLNQRGRTKESGWQILDEVAEEVGVRPTFWPIFKRSPRLAFQFLFGPVLPCHFRLFGPGARPGAWEQSLATYDNLFNNIAEENAKKTSTVLPVDTALGQRS